MKPSLRNIPAPKRQPPPCPAIVPDYVYPWRRLRDWSFGGRGIAALVKAGLPVIQFGKLKFFSGAGLIATLQGKNEPAALHPQSDAPAHSSAENNGHSAAGVARTVADGGPNE